MRSWRPSLQRLPPLVQSLWQSTTCAAIHVRKKGQLTAVLTTPTFKNGPKLGFRWACERGGRKVVAFDTTYIRPGRIGENVRPTLVAVHGRDHDRLQSLGLTAARGFHDGAWRGSRVGHRPVLRGVDDLVAMSLALYLRSEGLLAQRHGARSRDGILTAAATMNPGVVLLDLDIGRGPDARSSTAPRSSLWTLPHRLARHRAERHERRGPRREGAVRGRARCVPRCRCGRRAASPRS